MNDVSEAEDKNKGGRPLKFETVEILKKKINDYFNRCDPHTEMRRVIDGHDKEGSALYKEKEVLTLQIPYTITGLARALGTTRDVLLDYESGKYDDYDDTDFDGDRFSNVIKDSKLRVQQNAEEILLSGAPATGSIFWLKNNAGWRDKQEVDHTSGGERIQAAPVVVSNIVARKADDQEVGDAPTQVEASASSTDGQ